jgi:hypothetical protein
MRNQGEELRIIQECDRVKIIFANFIYQLKTPVLVSTEDQLRQAFHKENSKRILESFKQIPSFQLL